MMLGVSESRKPYKEFHLSSATTLKHLCQWTSETSFTTKGAVPAKTSQCKHINSIELENQIIKYALHNTEITEGR